MEKVQIQIPTLYLNGFPKSGLHLAVRYVLGMDLKAHNPTYNWMGTNPWTVEMSNLHIWGKNVATLQEGEFVKGHTGYLKTIEALFIMLGIGVVFVYRDLRDVVVSQMFHVLNKDDERYKHPNKALYQSMKSNEDVMLAIIEGADKYDGIISRWETYAPWLDSEWILPLRYEEMISNQYNTANKIYDYSLDIMQKSSDIVGVAPPEFRNIMLQRMIGEANNRKMSPTYRKGKSGGWRDHFTPKVIDSFKRHDNGWLVKLGYEESEDWH